MTRWSGNAATLQRRFPRVHELVSAAAPATADAGLGEAAADRVARLWLEGRSWSGRPFVAVSGLGDGSHVRALLEVLPAEGFVFVGVDDPGRLRRSFEDHDLRTLLEAPRLLLGVGPPDDAFFAPLAQVDVLRLTDVDALVFAPEYNRNPSYHGRFFLECARQIDFRRKLLGTAVVDAALWQENSLANLRVLGAAPDVGAFAGVFRGRAMILVSAGPSLDESLDFLRGAPPGVVIAAVNSSYRAVRRAGIVPHLVFAADPREFTARGFGGVPVDGTWLVTTPIVDPAVPRLFEGRVLCWSGANECFTELRRRLGWAAGTTLLEQGTVSACAIDFARLAGCTRICLVGQDLAVLEDGRSHATDSFYTDLEANSVRVDACRRLPGNTLPEVPVEAKLYVYLKTFEQLIAARPELQFLNTARLGARIAGAPFATFAEALAWLGPTGADEIAPSLAAVHARALGSGPRVEELLAALAPTRDYARTTLEAALAVAWADEPGAVAAASERLRRVLRPGSGDHALLEGGRTRLELFRCREAQARLREGAAPAPEHALAVEHAWAIAEGAWFLLRRLERLALPGPDVSAP